MYNVRDYPLVIFNKFITVVLMYFTIVFCWTVYQNYFLLHHMADYFMDVTV